jgi:protein translocase SecG subunit
MQIINIIQILLGIILVGLILIQSKGAGIGTTFGGDMGFYGTKRGAEKMIFILTMIVAFLFLTFSLVGVILTR